MTPLRQNCTIISDHTGDAVIVDPGGDVPALLKALEGLRVKAILLTHGHMDHAGGARALAAALAKRQGGPVPILGPLKAEAPLLASVEQQAASCGLEDMENVAPDRYLTDGETLNLLAHPLHVHHVPGHTPGHVVLHDAHGRKVITGDTLFKGTVGRSDFAYGDGRQLLQAIRDKLFTLPDETMVLPGHGMPSTIGYEKRHNPFFSRPQGH
ncbi:MBL fold metallo-hydrolase [Formicincola oecophyllae]|uniref:MBL fold metallo-hydrolase n=1 Tax=Formicincola oecophyllae TaxID=2558361 RepID=A0A4Y6UEA4_9PROT|nr:MBL fold metallo-hydrolase [Formicincola oecophyllae]